MINTLVLVENLTCSKLVDVVCLAIFYNMQYTSCTKLAPFSTDTIIYEKFMTIHFKLATPTLELVKCLRSKGQSHGPPCFRHF